MVHQTTEPMTIDDVIEYYRDHRSAGIRAMMTDCDMLEDKKYYQGKLATIDEFIEYLERHRQALELGMKPIGKPYVYNNLPGPDYSDCSNNYGGGTIMSCSIPEDEIL